MRLSSSPGSCLCAKVRTSKIEELAIDARPSDALALAVRSNAPVFVEDDVMNRAGTISYRTAQQSGEDEFKQFDQFVQTLSPDDF